MVGQKTDMFAIKIRNISLNILLVYIAFCIGKPLTFSFSLNKYNLSIKTYSGDKISTINQAFKSYDIKPLLITNGGIFNPDFTTTGLLIINDSTITPLNKQNGEGNFYFKPNGIFFIENNKPYIHITEEYIRRSPSPSIAIQSGPILVYNYQINSKLNPKSKSKYIRNGIGIDKKNRIHIVYFPDPCTLYEMAIFFKEQLNCNAALYLDGAISGLKTDNFAQNEDRPFASIIIVRKSAASDVHPEAANR